MNMAIPLMRGLGDGSDAGDGCIATPADAAMIIQLGAEGVFVGSGIVKSGDPVATIVVIARSARLRRSSSQSGKYDPCRSLGIAKSSVPVRVSNWRRR
ncbi:hypothetical protein A5784_04195 [Mycobacterium sp. 852013-50091_SCH5140682]|nr:hypothetical protein A5784_04195 [Mycobacterium sp. 852013-50091_SCH5140682]